MTYLDKATTAEIVRLDRTMEHYRIDTEARTVVSESILRLNEFLSSGRRMTPSDARGEMLFEMLEYFRGEELTFPHQDTPRACCG